MSVHFDIEELRTFVLLAENGHFTETAATLRISQPAVSQRIARLENTFGLMLFTRTAERASLTSYGQRVLDGAKRCVETHEAMARRLSQHQRSSTGSVRIWIDHSSLGDAFSALITQEPPEDRKLERVDSREGSAWQDRLKSFECDLVLSGAFLQSALPQGIRRIEFRKEDGLSALWSSEHHDIDRSRFSLAEAIKSPLLIPSENLVPGFRSFIADWCSRAYNHAPSEIVQFSSKADLFHSCRAGFGIGLVPGNLSVRPEAASLHLQTHPLFGDVLPNAYGYSLFLRAGEINEAVVQTAGWLTSIYQERFSGEPKTAAQEAKPLLRAI